MDCPGITKFWDGLSPIDIEPHSFFELIRIMRKDSIAEVSNNGLGGRPFLACQQGWSLFYSCVGDYDPQDINCELLCIKQGVPTNTRTNERKYRITDAPMLGMRRPKPVILDEKDSYLPRCVTKVVKRTEHYSSRSSGFWFSIRFDVEEQDFHQRSPSQQAGSGQRYSVYGSYGEFQYAMWGVVKTTPCTHQIEDGKRLPLDLDVQTIGGFPSKDDATLSLEEKARISLCLVKGDARARWLALCTITNKGDPSTGILFRCNGCCGDCAVKTASSMSGEWYVVL